VTIAPAAPGFSHETATYRGNGGFLDLVLPFVREGLARDEVVVVAEPRPRLEQLRAALGTDADAVELLDMGEVGSNPARIIAVWDEVLGRTTAAGRRLRGVGEPAFPGRSPAELAECLLHEILLNTAFDGGPAWRLMCPYDEGGLAPGVVAAAGPVHPVSCTAQGPQRNGDFAGDQAAAALGASLPAPTDGVLRGDFSAPDVPAVRRTVASFARSCGLSADRVDALQLAASELATNSVSHGGGTGLLAMWREPGAAVVEFSDAGTIADPLVGRLRPDARSDGGGRGLYLVNQLCDLVQLRSSAAGTTVRVTTWL
jgi:anti-sigma regulatory factor (Ser/Thr protein kinase)